jgi:calcineurin-like phosphoesterase family protein
MKTFFTSDTHFSHTNIIKYENRPFNTSNYMNEVLISRWNSKVNKEDVIYHLGDFAFGNESNIHKILNQLNGKIYLIYGNHDKEIKRNKSLQNRFIWCRDYYKLKINNQILILFHYPIQVWDMKHHGSLHFYGHIHSNKENHHPMVEQLENAYNLGVDVCDFEPKTLEEILCKEN